MGGGTAKPCTSNQRSGLAIFQNHVRVQLCSGQHPHLWLSSVLLLLLLPLPLSCVIRSNPSHWFCQYLHVQPLSSVNIYLFAEPIPTFLHISSQNRDGSPQSRVQSQEGAQGTKGEGSRSCQEDKEDSEGKISFLFKVGCFLFVES